MSKENVPLLRFKGFINAWEQRKLRKVLDLLKDGTHGTHKNVSNGIYLLSAKNIKNGQIIIDNLSDRKISEEEYNSIHKNFVLKKGDVLLTIVGSIGETAIIETPNKITFQRSVAYLRPNKELQSEFLFTTISSGKFQLELKKRQVVSAQPGIYLGDLSIIPIQLPNLKEQQKIGSFFKQLDDTITLHQRKLDLLNQLKRGFLQQMFPKNGETVPKLRFTTFDGDWQQRKLKEVGKISTGNTPSTSDKENYSKNGILWITPTDIKNLVTTDSAKRLSNKGANKAKIVSAGTILVTCIASIGKNTLVEVKSGFNQQINSLSPTKNNDSYFLLTQSELWSRKMKNFAASGTMQIVNKTVFSNLNFLFPSFREQQKIGVFFKQLDDTITLHQQKLILLKQLKKVFLQKLFI